MELQGDDITNLLKDLSVAQFTLNMIEKTIQKSFIQEIKSDIAIFEDIVYTTTKKLYNLSRENYSEYYQNKHGVEVFKLNNQYLCFTFENDLLVSPDIDVFNLKGNNRIVKIIR